MDLRQLRSLTTDRFFARGEAYFNEGRVNNLAEDDGTLTATVEGQRDYRVSLRSGNSKVEYSCDCPVGLEGAFCKHLVAATLAWISPDADATGKTSERKRRETTEEKLRAFLELQDKTALVELLSNEAAENRALRERLLLQAARINSGGVDLAAYRNAISRATRTNGFVDYREAYDYARRIHLVIESIAALLKDGHAAAVIDLTEYMLAKLENAIESMDDSDGHMSVILLELQDIHHSACLEAKPDPVTLARHLFEWEIKSDWEIFYGSVNDYADVFGAEGLAEYRRLAESEWSKIRSLGPDEKDEELSSKRFRITSIMEALARQTGDPEAIVEVKRRNLSHSYSYLQIAEIYREAGEDDKALDWADQGLKAFARRDSRLVEFLAQEYHRRARHDDAMKLIWEQFVESPSLGHYQELKANALKVQPIANWAGWREKALDRLRNLIAHEKQLEKPRDWHWVTRVDNSLLVEVFLWEKRYDDAWQEASVGGCSDALWLRVAATREEKHPDDAVPIYKEIIVTILKRANNSAYEEAIKLVRKIRELMIRMGRENEFGDYLTALRVEYKRKRNFMKLLEGIER
ncbi:MAG: SWIM zinc finger family protein [Acidobacteriota bacterium]